MDGYTILAGFLIFFLLFIYLTWFGFSVKVENEKEEQTSENMLFAEWFIPHNFKHTTLHIYIYIIYWSVIL